MYLQIKNDSSVKRGDQTDPKDGKTIKILGNEKIVFPNQGKETPKMAKPQFKCDACGAIFKKEITLKKHYNTKQEEQNYKVWNVMFKSSMEVLQHVTKEHNDNIIANISVKEKEQQMCPYEEDIPEDNINTSTHFKCFQCKEIFSIEDKFNDDLQNNQMCKLCTMTQAYGLYKKGLGPALERTALHRGCEKRRFIPQSTECLGLFIQ